jgi:hypothetical protein
MFRPLSVLASRLPNAIIWTVEPNTFTEPYCKKENQEKMYQRLLQIQQYILRQITVPQKPRLPLKN